MIRALAAVLEDIAAEYGHGHSDDLALVGGFEVSVERAERLGHRADWREQFDFATARAVGPLAVQLELALPLLKHGGRLLAQKGPDPSDELDDAQAALELLGGRMALVHDIELPGLLPCRTIVEIEKVSPTPERYPRRPGLPAKRPLGPS